MRIGVDIDGVLVDVENFELGYGSKFFYNVNKQIANPNGDGSSQIFNVTMQEDDKFWSEAIYKYIKIHARPFASEVLKKLIAQGHEIYIITNRVSNLDYCNISKQKMQAIVKKWLKKNKIPYTKLIFSTNFKEKEILENKIDILIDDNPKIINTISKYINVICYDARYNKNITTKNVIRCYTWYDILSKIENLK